VSGQYKNTFYSCIPGILVTVVEGVEQAHNYTCLNDLIAKILYYNIGEGNKQYERTSDGPCFASPAKNEAVLKLA
jgi:hypothetical protein